MIHCGAIMAQVVVRKEAWRVLAAPFVHTDVPHLLLDLLGLWPAAAVESMQGSWVYLRCTTELLVQSVVAAARGG